MDRTCIDSTLNELAEIETNWRLFDPRLVSAWENQIQTLQLELKFLKLFLGCLGEWNRANNNLSTLKNIIEAAFRKAGQGLFTAAIEALNAEIFGRPHEDTRNWDLLAYGLLKEVQQFKPKIKATCLDHIDCSPPCKSPTSYEFVESILQNLDDLISLKADMIVDMKKQIGILQEKLKLYGNFIGLATKLPINREEFKDLKTHSQSWAYDAACLSLLYWVDNVEEKVAPRMKLLLDDLIRKIKPVVLEVGMYFGVASKSLRHDSFLVAEVVHDRLEIVHVGLIFLVSLIIHPPVGDPEDGILTSTRADAVVKEAASLLSSYCFGEVKENIANKENGVLSAFIGKVGAIKEKVVQLHHARIPYSSLDFPKTNGLGFMDILLRNLEEKQECWSIPIAKHQWLAVQKGLMLMRESLKDILKLQSECSEVKDLWKQIINMAYTAEHVIDSFSIDDSPMWCNMMCLSNVMEEIESITTKFKKMKDKQMFNIRSVMTDEILINGANSISQTRVFVGFEDEEKAINDLLRSPSIKRDIVSIVGIPGSGKTTLVKRVYDSAPVRAQFPKHAWCCVSQVYKRRALLRAILKDVGHSVSQIQEESEEALERLLFQRLKGQKYLVVLDDIWDTEAWKELQRSFPDDENGSRIMLTSRYVDVALQANHDSPPHFLRQFSDEECWVLLRKLLFHTDVCPSKLLGVGMQIAKKCQGLPLAVVVIAGILAKEVKNLSWWRQIEESLGSQFAGTTYMDILELSYNQLPDFLKPCFLYLGAFEEDQKIDAKALTLFWIAEGFILNPGSKSLEEVAQEYLMDLFSRNLVLVSRKSSTGGIKECYVHDLILELCRKKAQEESFMALVREDDIEEKQFGSQSNPTRYEKYRLSIHATPLAFCDLSAKGPCVRSIIFTHSLYYQSGYIFNICNNFKFLKVLHLLDIHGGSSEQWLKSFPIELTSMVHLTYLAVIACFKSIPPSIANLENLETFLLHALFGEIKLPNAMWKMRKLRRVKIEEAVICSSDHVFEEFDELNNIEYFSGIVIEHEGDVEKLVRRIPRVRKLKFYIRRSEDDPFSMLGLDSFSRLEALSLTDERYAIRHPREDAIRLPSSLKKLTLCGLCQPWKEISVIGKLPNLEVLKLSNDAFAGEIWDVKDEEFLNLKCLKLYDMDFSQWNAFSDPFPRLQQLYVENCMVLEEIPSSFGASTTLKTIHVVCCGDGAIRSARQIVQEQQDLGNDDLEVDIIEFPSA